MEFRVWIEDGTLLGHAVASGNTFEVDDAPANSGYAGWAYDDFDTPGTAEQYAREWADGLAEWARETCDCDGYDCGVMSEHGISIQEVES